MPYSVTGQTANCKFAFFFGQFTLASWISITRSYSLPNSLKLTFFSSFLAPVIADLYPLLTGPSRVARMAVPAIRPSRSWFGTLNNWTREELTKLTTTSRSLYCHAVVAQEIAPNTGTPHLQFNLTFLKMMTLAQVKLLSPRAHWEVTRSLRAAERYCMKKDTDPAKIWLCDNRVRAKTSVETTERLEMYAEELKAGKSVTAIARENIVEAAKDYQRLEWMSSRLAPTRSEKPTVTWCYGKTGTGKSMWCHEQARLLGDDYHTQSGSFKWFDGYDGQDVVVVEEFRGGDAKLSELLRFLDGYPLRVPYKGGFQQMRARHVFINSCFKPEECYRTLAEDLAQLKRRIDTIIEFEVVAGIYVRTDRSPQAPMELADIVGEVDVPMEQQWYGQ